MIGLIQRVTRAEVSVEGHALGAIGPGILALIGVRPADDRPDAERLLERLLGYRIFADAAGRMSLSLADTGGGLLLVPQFTLAADTARGNRAGFSSAAPPEQARELFAYLVSRAQARHAPIATGEFGAHMQVMLVNDGPVTFWLDT
jgi:D-tyrosyl-tRNA(Tyr) deacylase